MAGQLKPQTVVVDGRTYVNRDWIREYTGASVRTASLWYSKRDEVPSNLGTDDEGKPVHYARHPEKAFTTNRTDFYDQEQFEAFFADLKGRQKKAVIAS